MNSNEVSRICQNSAIVKQTSDAGTQYKYQFNENQIKLINEYKSYYEESLMAIEELLEEGPEGIEFPKKPKGNLDQLFIKKTDKKLLSVDELNDFLMKHIVDDYFSMIIKVDSISSVHLANLESLSGILRTGFHTLKKQHKQMLASSLDYGVLLNVAYEVFELQKLGGKSIGTWKNWVLTNIGISDRYERELREMSRILSNYPKFRQLGIPFADLRKMKNLIEYHLKTNQAFARFWQQT